MHTDHHDDPAPPLTDEQIEAFVTDGVVRLEAAFPTDLAEAGRQILWPDLDADPDEPATWTEPVVRLDQYTQEPFRRAATTPRLHAAFDQLVGAGRWQPRGSLGTWPVRFPHDADPGDAGWHVEASWVDDDGCQRMDVASTGRALLLLFLFSDVGERDAPTRIRLGSHPDVVRLLAPAGRAGREFFELAAEAEDATAHRRVALATGNAGDVWLCHPFVVHAAQSHHGTRPRFMAQPPLLPAEGTGPDPASPMYRAIEHALGSADPG